MAQLPLNARRHGSLLERLAGSRIHLFKVEQLAAELAVLTREEQDFILGWIKRIASTHIWTLAWQFGRRAPALLRRMERRLMEAWACSACDVYDRTGLRPALQSDGRRSTLRRKQLEMTAGVLFDDIAGVLGNFVGASPAAAAPSCRRRNGPIRKSIVLPGDRRLPEPGRQLQLAKATVAMLWAQTRFRHLARRPGRHLRRFRRPRSARWPVTRAGNAAAGALHRVRTARPAPRDGTPARQLNSTPCRRAGSPSHNAWQPEATLDDSLDPARRRLPICPILPAWSDQGCCARMPIAAPSPPGGQGKSAAAHQAGRIAGGAHPPRSRIRKCRITRRRKPTNLLSKPKPRDENGRLDFEITLDGAPIAPPDDVKAVAAHLDLPRLWRNSPGIPRPRGRRRIRPQPALRSARRPRRGVAGHLSRERRRCSIRSGTWAASITARTGA
jgi:nitric oxide reductase NorD protein